MNTLVKILVILIPLLEGVNLYIGENLSIEAFALIGITVTLVSTILTLEVEDKVVNIILGVWIIFMVLFFALGIGKNLIKSISPLLNTINLIWAATYPALYKWIKEKKN